jgi:hypothetical protein
MSSLSKANWDRQAGGRAQVSIGMHAHPKMFIIKMTSKYLSQISQQPQIGSSSNLELKLRRPNQNCKSFEINTPSDGRQPQH